MTEHMNTDDNNLDAARQRFQRIKQRKQAAAAAAAHHKDNQNPQGKGRWGDTQEGKTSIPPPPPPPPQQLAPIPIRPLARHSSWHPGAANVSNNRTASGRKMQSAARLRQKYQKPSSWYHQIAAKNRLGSIHEDAFAGEEEEQDEDETTTSPPAAAAAAAAAANSSPGCDCTRHAKEALLEELNRTGGESNTPAFQEALQKLLQHYDATRFDPRKPVPRYFTPETAAHNLEGVGIAAGKPTFAGCLGRNEQGDAMYQLGAMTFGMFGPHSLVVSVQGTFVLIDTVDGHNPDRVKNVPSNLLADVRFGRSPVRSYDLVTPITVEPWKPEFGDDSPNKGVDKPIRGVLTSYGFIHPYPTQNRFSVWFTGGSLEVDDTKNEKWFQIFDNNNNNNDNNNDNNDSNGQSKEAPKAQAGQWEAAMKLLGVSSNNNRLDADGRLTYTMTKPQASHIDLLYLDKTLQVLRGSSGTVYVHVRLPGSKAVQESVRSDGLLPAPVDPLRGEEHQHDEKENRHSALALEYYYNDGNNGNLLSFRGGRRRSLSSTLSRNAQSASNLLDLASQSSLGAEARLKELQSFAININNNNNSCSQEGAVSFPKSSNSQGSLLGRAKEYASRGFKKAKPKNGVAGVA